MTSRIVVAGGGIAGLATAIALCRRGRPVSVLERAPRIAPVGSGLVLYPNGMRAVDALGPELGAVVRGSGHEVGPAERRLIVGADGEVLAEEPIGEVPMRLGSPQVSLLRSALHDALLREARAAGAEIVLGAVASGFEQHGDSVGLLLRDGREVRGAALVGADGLRSTVRAGLLGHSAPVYRGYTSVRGRCDRPPSGARAAVVNGAGAQLFVAPVGGGRVYWTAKVTAAEGVWPALGPRGAWERLINLTERWPGPAAALVRDSDPADLAVTDIHDRDPVHDWAAGRVVLLGDAAHPMVPALGQGANLALEDAVVLGDVLDGVRDEDVPAALRRFARLRSPRAERVVTASRKQGALDQGDDTRAAADRDARTRRSGRKDVTVTELLDWRPETAPPGAAASASSTRSATRAARPDSPQEEPV